MGPVALLLAGAAGCTPVAGADRLWAPAVRRVLVGEIHGTVETPAAFANLACLAAAAGRRVTVALEWDANDQATVDAYLASDGGAAARAALLDRRIWREPFQDGRGSTAMLALFERLRLMMRAGTVAKVVCSDADTRPGQTRDAAMAAAWRAVPLAPRGLLLALAGNVHTMRLPTTFRGRTVHTAGSLLPREGRVTVSVDNNGGQSWSCQADGCRVHANGRPRDAAPGLVVATDPRAQWDAVLELGRATTAALPAVAPAGDAPPPPASVHIGP